MKEMEVIQKLKGIRNFINTSLLPNQSLKLTEPAVDDFAARQYAENDMISRYVRATDYMELAVRRRSLAPVR
jgi:hypothetical protein